METMRISVRSSPVALLDELIRSCFTLVYNCHCWCVAVSPVFSRDTTGNFGDPKAYRVFPPVIYVISVAE